ncbi:hypothetical protein BC830DRAFT_1171199 [Chytriomyces sp. MP71]|nr:hypothetical protein BC830DRAFT_1171199 [Chytriomyces sp. MP71]
MLHPFPDMCVSSNRRITSCEACRLSNRKCSREAVCDRCEKKGLPCVYSKNSTRNKAFKELKRQKKDASIRKVSTRSQRGAAKLRLDTSKLVIDSKQEPATPSTPAPDSESATPSATQTDSPASFQEAVVSPVAKEVLPQASDLFHFAGEGAPFLSQPSVEMDPILAPSEFFSHLPPTPYPPQELKVEMPFPPTPFVKPDVSMLDHTFMVPSQTQHHQHQHLFPISQQTTFPFMHASDLYLPDLVDMTPIIPSSQPFIAGYHQPPLLAFAALPHEQYLPSDSQWLSPV